MEHQHKPIKHILKKLRTRPQKSWPCSQLFVDSTTLTFSTRKKNRRKTNKKTMETSTCFRRGRLPCFRDRDSKVLSVPRSPSWSSCCQMPADPHPNFAFCPLNYKRKHTATASLNMQNVQHINIYTAQWLAVIIKPLCTLTCTRPSRILYNMWLCQRSQVTGTFSTIKQHSAIKII